MVRSRSRVDVRGAAGSESDGEAAALRPWSELIGEPPGVMGVLNVTPDSFSDGGRFGTSADAIAAGIAMARAGAAMVDVGGESTRPGAQPVPPEVELRRVVEVVRGLAAAGVAVSIDTRNAATMEAALRAGALVVNDVSALAHDPAAASVVAAHGCNVILNHMRGTPATMMNMREYDDVPADVAAELAARLAAARAAGIAEAAVALDPGIGFAKGMRQSIAMLRGLEALAEMGLPVIVGVSRKAFLGALTENPTPGERLGGSIAAGLFAVVHGASMLRVHDVPETVQALRVWRALAGTRPS